MRSMDKGRVEKKGRFTIIDLPLDVTSPSFHQSIKRSPSGESTDDEVFDDYKADKPHTKTRIKQKGRFTIIDYHPTTPSPESSARQVFEDLEDEPVKETSVNTVATAAAPSKVLNENSTQCDHVSTCCHFRTNLMHPSTSYESTPLCTLAFPTESTCDNQQCQYVVISHEQYQQQQNLLATLQQENKELQNITKILQEQQRQLFQLVKSFQQPNNT
ncbi:hypothetical protein THRCLA_02114 [Thraustotheca clavata]|uniref:Uncharacterized protein n=1 Tax=Thraustotheca clavata TaxID=74557 RepID=A0A1W0A679_9STRA|nr:hypothetical protein THRCLA_02114 [Thraustotheca clavata]